MIYRMSSKTGELYLLPNPGKNDGELPLKYKVMLSISRLKTSMTFGG